MKKVLFGLFYVVQGIGNLIFALLSFMHPPFGFTFGILPFFGSILSIVAVLLLLRKDEESALSSGIASSFLYGIFYGLMAVVNWGMLTNPGEIHPDFRQQTYTFHLVSLPLSIIIVELNIISIFILYKSKKDKSI